MTTVLNAPSVLYKVGLGMVCQAGIHSPLLRMFSTAFSSVYQVPSFTPASNEAQWYYRMMMVMMSWDNEKRSYWAFRVMGDGKNLLCFRKLY